MNLVDSSPLVKNLNLKMVGLVYWMNLKRKEIHNNDLCIVDGIIFDLDTASGLNG